MTLRDQIEALPSYYFLKPNQLIDRRAVLDIIDDHMKEDAEREEEIFLRNQDAIWAGERDDPV